jgi:uncharacterized membrane protein
MSTEHLSDHGRKQFQVDRIAFFSDAIVAIAITLQILEFINPARGKDKTWADIQQEDPRRIIVPLVVLLVRYASIGNRWIRHHDLFQHVKNYRISFPLVHRTESGIIRNLITFVV